MIDAFHTGGWGMYPTMVFGVLLLLMTARYAMRPERRFVPLILALGTVTLASGALGFVTGLIASFQYISNVPPGRHWIALVGVGESLNNVAFALVFIVLGSLAMSIGAWKIARDSEMA